jgi:predicted Holliday junction resolvase-like endonuclease
MTTFNFVFFAGLFIAAVLLFYRSYRSIKEINRFWDHIKKIDEEKYKHRELALKALSEDRMAECQWHRQIAERLHDVTTDAINERHRRKYG